MDAEPAPDDRLRGEGTQRVYPSAWRGYTNWCTSLGRKPPASEPDLLVMSAGLASIVGDGDAALPDLLRQTRHRSTQVALACLRAANLGRNNVTQGCSGAVHTDG